jgi:hypothetical protein
MQSLHSLKHMDGAVVTARRRIALRITSRFTYAAEGTADGLKVVMDDWDAQFPVEYVDVVPLPSGPTISTVMISSAKIS